MPGFENMKAWGLEEWRGLLANALLLVSALIFIKFFSTRNIIF